MIGLAGKMLVIGREHADGAIVFRARFSIAAGIAGEQEQVER